jgi:toxin ParE1/3/4
MPPPPIAIAYSRRARLDLLDIADYTLRTWSSKQAGSYLNRIQDCCERLAVYPMLGRECNQIAHGLRHIEEGQHMIFYRVSDTKVTVVRILHRSMLPERHLTAE